MCIRDSHHTILGNGEKNCALKKIKVLTTKCNAGTTIKDRKNKVGETLMLNETLWDRTISQTENNINKIKCNNKNNN